MPHPLCIALCQVLIDRDQLAVSSRESVQVKRERCDKRLSFPGLHFRNGLTVQGNAANQLNIVMHHIPGIGGADVFNRTPTQTPRRILHGGKSLRKKIVQGFTVLEALPELRSLGLELLIREGLVGYLQFVNPFNERATLTVELFIMPPREALE